MNLNVFFLLILLVGISNISICQKYDFDKNIKELDGLVGQTYIKKSLELCEQFSLFRDFENAKLYCDKSIKETKKISKNKNTIAFILKEISKRYLNSNSKNVSFHQESYESAKNSLKYSTDPNLNKENLEILFYLEKNVSDVELDSKISDEIDRTIKNKELPKDYLRELIEKPIENQIDKPIDKPDEKLEKKLVKRPIEKRIVKPTSLEFNFDELILKNDKLKRDLKTQKSDKRDLLDSLQKSSIDIQEKTIALDSLKREIKIEKDSLLFLREQHSELEERSKLQERQTNLFRTISFLGFLLSALLIFSLLYFRKINKRLAEKSAIINREKKKSENALRREAESLRELKERETQFYTNITHEIRTPLTVINGMATQISENPKKWLESGTSRIKKSTNEILDLVNALLDMSKVDSGFMDVSNIQSDIIAYISYLVESYTSFAESKGINLTTEIITGRCIMDFDREKIKTIIVNLISNAIKYSTSNGKVIVRLEEINSDTNPQLKIDIVDNGIGIKKEDQEKLFERYFQVINEDTKDKAGSGIGLSHTKSLVDLIGGEIFVESELGKGSTFTLKIPITNKADFIKFQDLPLELLKSSLIEESVDIKVLKENLLSDKDKLTLLIIEDNEEVLFTIVSLLEALYNVIVERNGVDGINRAIKEIPDIILSDVMMPGKDGFEVCKSLKEHVLTSHIPIILLTALNDHDNERKGISSGADGFITKPPDEAKLILLISNRLQNRERVIGNHSEIVKHRNPQNGPNDMFLLKLNEVIEKNLSNENLNREVLCDELDIKLNQLYKKVNAVSGLSITNYIKSYRIGRAKEMLSDPKNQDIQVQEIAWDVGIEPNYFVKVFKSIIGQTPNEYRKDLFDS